MGQQTSAPPAHPTSSPAPAGGGGVAAVSPAWSRPDDASRQAQLDAMKRRATGLLALAVVVFVAARIFEAQYPWLGWVRATAEASLVGGLADWFAVTALFRHPLGLPIPHTAIVATRKERIGQILGNFVQNHFLSRDVIAANLRRGHPAERGAKWLADREHARQISRQFASGLAKTLDSLPPNELQDLITQVVRNRVMSIQVAPALGKTLALALADNRHEELLNAAVRLEADALRNHRELIGTRVRTEHPWREPPMLEHKNNQKIIAADDGLLHDKVIDLTASVVEKYRHEIGDLIAQTVASWDAAATSRRFELAVGRDLQFVRINGTLVGGLVGLVIYTITRFLH